MDNYKLFSRKLSFRFSNLLLISIVMISKIQFTGCSTTCKGIQLLTDTSCFNDVITFNHDVARIYETVNGDNTLDLINSINELNADGGTNIYSSSEQALKILSKESNDYTKTVILMTDGYSNNGSFLNLSQFYNANEINIPIYSITFGSSSDSQLQEIAQLSNAKVFDGKSGLLSAFKEVRSYN